MTRRRMLLRLLLRAAWVRRERALTALAAFAVAAAASTTMLNLYSDADAKLRREFRSYGANIVIVPRSGSGLPPDALQRAEGVLGDQGLVVPFAYAVAKTSDGAPVVVAGTDLERARRMNTWWQVTAWPLTADDALLGVRAADALGTSHPFDLSFQGRHLRLHPAGTVRTGSSEDSRIYISLDRFSAWTEVGPSVLEVAANGTAQQVSDAVARLAVALPEADVRPLRRIVEAEAQVLGKTQSALLACVCLIILISALGVLATLTASVFDRRKDFALMKALGASQSTVNAIFAAESLLLGLLGALVGYLVGVGLAAWIGRASFHAAVEPRLGVLPVIVAGSLAMALLAALLPLSVLRSVQPAVMLKGE
ncbi:MAG TPA: FtsX-like permease family protein [Terriglobales bacterium]|nr:FtsX-like permease family protein [Terriglobales bacterium]